MPGLDKGHGGDFELGAEPSVVFDRDGNAYYTCLAFNFPPSLGSAGAIFVSKSTDGGVSWGTPIAVRNPENNPGRSVGRFEDHQLITANPANGNL